MARKCSFYNNIMPIDSKPTIVSEVNVNNKLFDYEIDGIPYPHPDRKMAKANQSITIQESSW